VEIWSMISIQGKPDFSVPEVQEHWKILSKWCLPWIKTSSVSEPESVRTGKGPSEADWKYMTLLSLWKWLNQPNTCRIDIRARPALVLGFSGSRVLGIVGLQIAHALSNAGGKEPCSGCGKAIRPSPKAVRGVRRYCPSCRRRKIPQRDAVRDVRRR